MKANRKGALLPVDDSKSNEYFMSIEDIDKFSDIPAIDKNPFLPDVINNEVRKANRFERIDEGHGYGKSEYINEETGEIAGVQRSLVISEEVDDSKFVKLFNSGMKDTFGLSGTAMKVFHYFVHAMTRPVNINRDMIYFDVNDCMTFSKFSTNNSVYKGLTELIKKKFLAKSDTKHMFYIDPSKVFNGDRLLVIKDYIRKEADHFDDKSLTE